MENPSFIALSHQMALRRRMDVIANNIANASTPGFKSERLLFAELLKGRTPLGPGSRASTPLSFVDELGTLRDVSTGPLMQTGNALDLAIHGRGYFVVETPDGPRYTRQSAFRLDDGGRIVTSEGHPLLGQGDGPIVIRPGDTRIEISGAGTVVTESGEAGRIRMVTFDDEQAMRKVGVGLYESEAEPQAADPKAEIRQGMVEGSNVQAVAEITSMIEVMRRYQSAQRIIDTEHELSRRSLERLARVG